MIAAIIGTALVAKLLGVPFMKEVKWKYFLILPIVFLILRVLFHVFGWVFGILFFFVGVDALLWFVDNCTSIGSGEWPFYTGQILATVFNSVF